MDASRLLRFEVSANSSRAVTVTVCLAVLTTLVIPIQAVARWEADPNAPVKCDQTTQGQSTGDSQNIDYTSTTKLPPCLLPAGPNLDSTDNPSRKQTTAPALNDHCTETYRAPVALMGVGSGGMIVGYLGKLTPPDRPPIPYEAYILDRDAQDYASTHRAFLDFVRKGTEQWVDPANQSAGLQCQLTGDWISSCQGDPREVPELYKRCLSWTGVGITPTTSPSPDWTQYAALAVAELKGRAGEIHSAPSEKGLVNMPTCFWVDEVGIPNQISKTVILPGRIDPNAGGRQIFYTYVIRIAFSHMEWNFDDQEDPNNRQAGSNPDSGQHPFLATHSYTHHSENGRHPDGRYHVSVKEHYEITVDQYYVDSDAGGFPQRHHNSLDPGASPPVISPAEHPQFIGQVIPIGVN